MLFLKGEIFCSVNIEKLFETEQLFKSCYINAKLPKKNQEKGFLEVLIMQVQSQI